MGFLKRILNKREERIETYSDFWTWFRANEKAFHKAVKNNKNLEHTFFKPLSEKVADLQDGCYFLTGMADGDTAELIFTPDGIVKNVVFAEELVRAAPIITGWKFIALKPSVDIEKLGIEIENYFFDKNNIFFTPVSDRNRPDEIDIDVVYKNYNVHDRSVIETGIYVFIDNYLGELNVVTAIDNLELIEVPGPGEELIPIHKLKDFIIWREKEFIEKYEGIRHHTENDTYGLLEATLDNGKPWMAIVNTTLMEWDAKASHPWILNIGITYNGSDNHGLPDTETGELMNSIEEEIMKELKDSDGYLNIVRETGNDMREIYFACRDFRKPSKIMNQIVKKYLSKIDLNYEIFKDKYWKSLERFSV